MTSNKAALFWAMTLVLTVGIFIFDLLTPMGVAAWALYALPIMLIYWRTPPGYIPLYTLAATGLIVVGFFLSPPGVTPAMEILNRCLGTGVLWFTAMVLVQQQHLKGSLSRECDLTGSILNSLPGIYFLCDDQGHFLRWNHRFETVTGYSSAEMAQRHLLDFFVGAEREFLAESMATVFRTGKTEVEAEFAAWNGRRTPYYFTCMRAEFEGRPCLFGMGIDITARKQADAALYDSQQTLQLTVEAAHIGHWDLDLVTHKASRSLQHDRIFGYEESPGDWSYERFLTHVHPEDRENADRLFQAGVAAKTQWDVECRIVRRDGVTRWIWTHGNVFTNAAGDAVRMLGIVSDITERKQTGEAAIRLAALVENSDDAIVGKDLRGIVTSWNAGAEKLFGYLASEMIGQSITKIIPADRQDEEAKILAHIARGETVRTFETVRSRKNGSTFEVSLTVSAIRDSAGTIVGASKVARDITERKQAEAALRESEKNFRALLDNLQVGVSLHGTKAEVLWCNRKVLELLDLTEEQYLGTSALDPEWNIIDEKGAPVAACEYPVPQAIAIGQPVRSVALGAQRPTMKTRAWMLVEAVPQLTSDGVVRQVIATFVDISERKKAVEALRDSEEKFSKAFHSNPAMLILTTLDGKAVDFNQTYVDFMGFSREEMLGKSTVDLQMLSVEERQRLVGLIRQAGGTLRNCETIVRLRDAKVRHMLFSADLISLRGVPHRLVTLLDITDRKQAEKALRESEARYRSLFERAPDGILIADSEGHYLDANAAICRMLGYNRDELLALRPSDIVAPAEIPRIEPTFHAVKVGADYHREWQFRRKDGSTFPAEVVAGQMPDGNPMEMIRDITERKQIQKEQEKRLNAEAADRIKSAFLATMSHELRTPLNSIIGFTGIIIQGLAGPLNPEQSKQLGMVRASARHLLALINDVLDISKIEAGQLEVFHEPFDLRQSITKVIALVMPLAENKRLALCVQVAPELGQAVGDERRFEQILLNLLSNALKFTDRGEVALTAEAVADFKLPGGTSGQPAVRLRVSDTGIGINPEDLATLFQPFRQIDSGLSRNHDGTGLGLAISRRLTELMGGEIGAESTWAQGSTFSVTLPLKGPMKT